MQHDFSFYPSHQLALCILTGHGAAVGALIFVPMPKAALVLLLIVLMWSAIYYVLRDARLTLEGAWVAMRLEDNRVIFFNRNGDESTGKLLRSSVVTPHLVILNIVLPGRRSGRSVVLMPDSMDEESFRQLRVVLKWGVALAA
jgi:toxin CptA